MRCPQCDATIPEQSKFCPQCGSCHEMQPYEVSSADKWGNSIAETAPTMQVVHAQLGYGCLDCRQLTKEQSDEMAEVWATGNYEILNTKSGQQALVEHYLDLVFGQQKACRRN